MTGFTYTARGMSRGFKTDLQIDNDYDLIVKPYERFVNQ